MQAHIAGYVMRAPDKDATKKFYEALGLQFHEHQHGGPMHFEIGPNSPDIVFELYRASLEYPLDAIMLEVDSINDAIAVCKTLDIPGYEMHMHMAGTLVFVTDPDGRNVMLFEMKK